MSRPSFAWLLFALVACGGEDRGRPSSEPPEPPEERDPCLADDGHDFQAIVDFDYTVPNGPIAQCDAGVFVPLTTDPNNASCMYLNYDSAHSWGGEDCKTPTGPNTYAEVEPRTGRNVRGEPIGGDGLCGSPESGLHFIGRNVATCIGTNGRLGWGASLEISLSTSESLGTNTGAGGASGMGGAGGADGSGDTPGENGFDARDWDGISFWIRQNAAGARAFIVTVSDPATAGEPYCSTLETVADSEKCDAFGTAITLTDEWTLVKAPFSALRQKGFGVVSPFGEIDRGNIKRLNILASAGDWDFWVDDIAFYRAHR